MKINQYAGVLVMTLAVTAQTAYAAVVMQIDITDLNNVKFIAINENSQINDSDHTYGDGITLDNILTHGSAGESQMNDNLSASLSSSFGPYDTIDGGDSKEFFGFPFALYIYIDSSEEDQVFRTGSPAFTGQGLADFSSNGFKLGVVCTTGDIVAGYRNNNVSEPIGQWQITNTTVNCPSVPEAPTNLSAEAGNGEAVINFDADPDNGSNITNYQYSLDGEAYTALDPAVTSSPITIKGLINGTTYSIRLQAINGVFVSVDSDEVDVSLPALPPDAPTGLSAEGGDGHVVITFIAGADNGLSITNYQYSLDGVAYPALSPVDSESPITITGLDNDTAYSIYLKAINDEGASDASDPVSVTPIAAPATTVPAAPTNLSAEAGNGKAVIKFDADPDNGSNITNYQYSLDGEAYTALDPAVTSSPITITGLINGTTYSIRLQAINSEGVSDASDPVSVTPATTPPTPQITDIDYGDTEIYISVSVASSAITGYSATCTGGGETFDSTSTTTRITVSGLTNGVAYICRVKATNGQGYSAASAASPPVTPEEAIAAGLPIWLLYEVSK